MFLVSAAIALQGKPLEYIIKVLKPLEMLGSATPPGEKEVPTHKAIYFMFELSFCLFL